MRVLDYDSGYVSMFEDLSPDVIKAQRQADLEQMARYRALKIAQYQAWSCPKARSDIQENYQRAEREAREGWRPEKSDAKHLRLEERITVRELHKPKKRPWWKRIFGL